LFFHDISSSRRFHAARRINIDVITNCPYCGHRLAKSVMNGISSCSNCCRVFESSHFNRLLSAAWVVRRQSITCPYVLINMGYAPEDAEMVVKYVCDECCNHEDFIAVLQQQKIILDLAS
jgi:ribosomal protein L37AE/L43A